MPILLATLAIAANKTDNNPQRYIDPRIGTAEHGHVFIGANVPFGFVQLGPTQHCRGWDWCSGYHYSDSILIGFGHQHLSGTGVGDLGDIAFLPVADTEQRETKFSHADEHSEAGYYSLTLRQPEVLVELTATERTGMHRYTFKDKNSKRLLRIDLRQGIGWDTPKATGINQESPTSVTGFRKSKGWAEAQQVFFAAEFSQPVKIAKQTGDTIVVLEAEGNANEPLTVKVGLSAVSVDNAKENMRHELPGWDFNATVNEAKGKWNKQLEKISVTTDNESLKRVFYTAMYHTMTAPSVFCDVNGDYYGADRKTHNGDFTNYTTLSLWDTYRAAHPLMTIIHPEKQADIAKTFINIWKQQGKLPVWHLMGCETNCMVGSPAVPVLADLVLKGFVNDKETAFEAMKTSQLIEPRSLGLLKKYGYIPYDKEPECETVAKALEYALADDAIAKVAKTLGKDDDYEYFYKRGQSYSKYFDENTHFMRAVGTDGKFHEPFNPFHASYQHDDYTEGNAWQYIWLVPHDVHGLVKLFGSEDAFAEKLDSLFIVEGDMGSTASPDITGLIGQYAHGNEPSHHIIYLYNYIGQPYKGARLARKVMKEMYGDGPDGLCGNEDVGQMSAWYVLSALGMYQVEPAGGRFILGSPLFDKAEINVGNGKRFVITANNNSEDNIYIQSVKLNGKSYKYSYIDFKDIRNGGTLEIEMGPQPSKFGTKKKFRP